MTGTPICLELFCGTANLTQTLASKGFKSIGIDNVGRVRTNHGHSVLLHATDLQCESSILALAAHPDFCYVHMAPPCGTTSRARGRPFPPHSFTSSVAKPPSCRSDTYPEGIPDLGARHPRVHFRVLHDNQLIRLYARFAQLLTEASVAWSVENPDSSYLWHCCGFPGGRRHRDRHGVVHPAPFWKNPFRISECGSRQAAISRFRAHLPTLPGFPDCLLSLFGARLVCHCHSGQACHGDVLIEVFAAVYFNAQTSVIARIGVFYAPHEHVAAATTLAHPFAALAADDTTKVAVARVLEWSPSRTRADWQELLRKWPARASALARRERLLHEAMDPHVAKVLKGKNLLLLKEILPESGFRGADDLVNSMSKGFDVIGDLAPTGQFEPQPRRRALSKETLWSRSRQVRSGILSSVGASGDAELDDEVTKATKEELEAGWLLGPFTEAELDCWLGLWLPAPRFGIRQGREGSLRVIDDYSIAGHNNGTSVAEKVDVGGVDVIFGIARCLLSAESSSELSLPLGDGEVV